MSRYRKYSDNYLEIKEALGLTEVIPMPRSSREHFIYELEKDKYRTNIIELRPNTDAYNTRNAIFAHSNFDKTPHYSQSDYDGRIFSWFVDISPYLLKLITQSGDTTYTEKVAFAYLDDHNIPCGFSLTRIGHDPDAQYVCTVFRNTTDTYTERDISIICPENMITSGNYNLKLSAHNAAILDNDTQILPSIKDKIGSDTIYQLLNMTLFKDGKISETQFANFKNRCNVYNFDRRDLKIKYVPRIFTLAETLDPRIATKIKKYYDKDPINFFEDSRYQRLIKDLFKTAQRQEPNNPALITQIQDLYLEMQVVGWYVKNKSKEVIITSLKQGIPQKGLAEIRNRLTTEIKPRHFDEQVYAAKVDKIFRDYHLEVSLRDLQQARDSCEISEIQQEIDTLLPWLSQFKLERLEPKKQNLLFKFITSLTEFAETPNTSNYTALIALYPKLRLDPSDLAADQPIIEAYYFRNQLSELRAEIEACEHMYVKAEAEKCVKFLTTHPFETMSPEEKTRMNALTSALIAFTNKPNAETFAALEKLYAEFHLLIPAQEKLLQPKTLANINFLIAPNMSQPYLFDPQGRQLLTSIDTEGKTLIMNRGFPNEATDNQFKQALFAKLTTSQAHKERIWQLLHTIPGHTIFPLQQTLHIYLNEIAQTYHNAMRTEGVTDHIRHAAYLRTLEEINPQVMQIFANELLRLSLDNGQPRTTLNIEALNSQLQAQVSHLQTVGKNLLLKHLRQQCQAASHLPQTKNTHASTQDEGSNGIVYYQNQNLVTCIETMQPDPNSEYLCYQHTVYPIHPTSGDVTEHVDRIRIQTSALNERSDLPTAQYQTQFQDRLTRLKHVYRYNPNKLLNYVVSSDNQQNESIQLTIDTVHAYNRRFIAILPPTQPLCMVQALDVSQQGSGLGYPWFDWSGISSEKTLMTEMALCGQIAAVYPKQKLNLTSYSAFLHPPTSWGAYLYRTLWKSKFFAFTPEGRETKSNIDQLKATWQLNLSADAVLTPTEKTARALQKMLAFDLHYEPEFALLVQALSLATAKQTVLEQDITGHDLALAIGHAQIFDQVVLPREIQPSFDMLLDVTDKDSALSAANLLTQAMHKYYNPRPTVAAVLPIIEEQTVTAGDASSQADIEQAKQFLHAQPPEPSSPKQAPSKTQSELGTSQKSSHPPRTRRQHHSPDSITRQHSGFFHHDQTNTENKPSLLQKSREKKSTSIRHNKGSRGGDE